MPCGMWGLFFFVGDGLYNCFNEVDDFSEEGWDLYLEGVDCKGMRSET